MVKIFVGNLSRYCSPSELRSLFEQYGEVSECEVVRNYAFVQMERLGPAEAAIRALHRSCVRGAHLRVGLAAARTRPPTTKLFVGNLAEPSSSSSSGADGGKGGSDSEPSSVMLRRLFQPFGRVLDVDVARRAAFVYMEGPAQAEAAIRGLDGTSRGGRSMLVRLSRDPAPVPGPGQQPPPHHRFGPAGPGPFPPPPHPQFARGRPQPRFMPPHYPPQYPAAAGCYRPPLPLPRGRHPAPAMMRRGGGMMPRPQHQPFFRPPYYSGY
uniref:RNA-binding protein 4B-like n=1 Tax=Pristiophorus japonicus TaxID=55135 RepID=UPI00398F2272